MDRSAIVAFSSQLRDAREKALRDSEEFDSIIHVCERLGSFLGKKIGDLGQYKRQLESEAVHSALAEELPQQWRGIHVPFSLLYDLVKDARNDALHQGAFARHLTMHAIQLSLILEDALRRSLDHPTAGDYMVSNPTCAELWQPISLIRQQMLSNSFSFLPVKCDTDWCVVSDLEIATYLGSEPSERRKKMAVSLSEAKIPLQPARVCTVDTPLADLLGKLAGHQAPLLVFPTQHRQTPVGIVTPFDLL